MNPAPAHLEAKLRFWEFTVGQIAAVFAGVLIGAVGEVPVPVRRDVGGASGTYLAALPVVPVFVASQTEFDLWGLICGALRWRRLDGRYVPAPAAPRPAICSRATVPTSMGPCTRSTSRRCGATHDPLERDTTGPRVPGDG